MRTTFVLTLLLSASVAAARQPITWNAGLGVDAQICFQRQPAALLYASAADRTPIVLADSGENYSIRIRNRTGCSVGVAVSIDGVNVISVGPALLSREDAAYIVDPDEELEIPGWRLNTSQIRRFQIVTDSASVAMTAGAPATERGWIRIMAFAPNIDSTVWSDRFQLADELSRQGCRQRSEMGIGGGILAGLLQPQTAGTGAGFVQSSRSRVVRFRPAAQPFDVLEFRYGFPEEILVRGLAADFEYPKRLEKLPPAYKLQSMHYR